MTQIPIRLRIVAGFTVAMAVVLAATGVFVYARLGGDLAQALDRDLSLRAQDVAALVREPGGSLAAESAGRLVERGESFAEVLDSRGTILDATPTLGPRPLLGSSSLRPALGVQRFVNLPAIPGLDEPVRLLALPVLRRGQRVVLVVGATRENRAEALRNLRTELLLAGPSALLIATALGYLLAGAGLRTVEAMRRRAAEISAARPGERLPVPGTGDELQRLATTLNAMLERLERALERERAFVAEASHELRTPLALLRAELDYALHYAQTETELRGAIQTASEETDRLLQLAGSLLLIASTDRGQLPLKRDEILIGELLESVHKRFAWRAEGLGRPLTTTHAPDKLIISGDRLRLEQALGNLVDNALRHGDGAVDIRAGATRSQLEITIEDNGDGIPEDLLPHAFQRFARGEKSRNGDGAGLGLAIVRAIAQAHGGSATASNAPHGGARVCITLPLGADPAPLRTSSEPDRVPRRPGFGVWGVHGEA